MQSHEIGIRAHDANHGLVAVSSALIEQYYRPTRAVGTAAQIASLIADQDVVPYDSVIASCAELKINGDLADRAIAVLEEVDFARVVKRSGQKQIEVRAVGIRERYARFGDEWEEEEPSEIESVTLEVLDALALMPRKAHDIRAGYDLSSRDAEIIRSIGETTGVLSTYRSPLDGEEIWYSPIYWEENPDKLFALGERHGVPHIVKALGKLRAYAGMPDEMIDDEVLRDAINTGVFPTPSIDSSGGEHHFAFLPPQGLKLFEKSIATKAMALVACARYAEHFAAFKLRYGPATLLRALLRDKFLNPHPEAPRQWGPLAALRVVRIDATDRGPQVSLIDTPENIQALNLAIQLMDVGEAEYTDADVESARQIVIPGMFSNPTQARVSYVRSAEYSKTPLEIVHSIMSGVSPDLAG